MNQELEKALQQRVVQCLVLVMERLEEDVKVALSHAAIISLLYALLHRSDAGVDVGLLKMAS
ncbi:hypothetical protein [Aeromonas caviae]|uniref:hypothetical protein n=1 Tax=Aeromonas caviae TaxID=648 RepID=UPI002B46CDE5|nr:hypothetical protein [Aeromonas caviae]